jgi:hypothetical protein
MMLDAIDRRLGDEQALDGAIGGNEGDLLDWLIGGDHHADRHAVAPPGDDGRSVDQIALAVAVGALPLSELRRALETRRADGPAPTAPCDGSEDVSCGSFLDRYLGAGVEPTFEDALALFPERAA